jgi:hypothetical protein
MQHITVGRWNFLNFRSGKFEFLGTASGGIFKFRGRALFMSYELCTRLAAPAALNPADRPHFYGHRRAADLDPRHHLFRRLDPSDVYHSGVDFNLPNPKPPLTSLRLA